MPLLFLLAVLESEEDGGLVGVIVTVRTWPVTVSSDVTGVGVQVDDVEWEVVVFSLLVVAAAAVVVVWVVEVVAVVVYIVRAC